VYESHLQEQKQQQAGGSAHSGRHLDSFGGMK